MTEHINPHASLAAMKAQTGRNLSDLIVLAAQNDPFNSGTAGHIAKAEWFATLFAEGRFSNGVHLRRIHYWAVSKEVALPNGQKYENSKKSWKELQDASKHARCMGYVDASAFSDQRNPDPVLFSPQSLEPVYPSWSISESFNWFRPYIDSDIYFDLALPRITVDGYDYSPADQPVNLAIITEKSTVNDVLLPICERHQVDLRSAAGFMSFTSLYQVVMRWAGSQKPLRILYVSDFDPAGVKMPPAAARAIEFVLFQQGFEWADIKLNPLVLTVKQVATYDLPRNEIDEDDMRKANFERTFGQGAVELDALEAIYPGVLGEIVENAILQYRDQDLEQNMYVAAQEARAATEESWQSMMADIAEERDKLESDYEDAIEPYRNTLEQLDEQLRHELAPLEVRRRELEQRAIDRLAELRHSTTIELPDRPDPCIQPHDESAWLFDGQRSYMKQLAHYKIHRGGNV